MEGSLNFSELLGWWTVERVNAASNVGLLVTAIMTAVLALGSMRQSRAIEVRANRPMMTAEALPPEGAGHPLKFLVTNRGRTVARNVSVSFEPPLPHPDLERLNASSDATFFYTPIERINHIYGGRAFDTWTPGMSIAADYWVLPNGSNAKTPPSNSAEGIPSSQGVRIQYQDETGKNYNDFFELDIRIAFASTFSEKDE